MKTVVILDNVRSVMNVGSIFRTANALKIEKIYLCGITPTPLDKYGKPRNDFSKVALGAEKTVAWEHAENTKELLKKLREDGYYVLAIEQSEKAVDYKKINIEKEKNVAFLVGAEVEGISQEVLNEASVIAEIPMLGTKESLNVTIAFAVATYRILGV